MCAPPLLPGRAAATLGDASAQASGSALTVGPGGSSRLRLLEHERVHDPLLGTGPLCGYSTVVDQCGRECRLTKLRCGFSGWAVTNALERWVADQGVPVRSPAIMVPSALYGRWKTGSGSAGPSSTSLAQGEPTRDGHIGNFNRRFCGECLNMNHVLYTRPCAGLLRGLGPRLESAQTAQRVRSPDPSEYAQTGHATPT